MTGGFPSERASNAENVSIWWRHHAWQHLNNDIANLSINTAYHSAKHYRPTGLGLYLLSVRHRFIISHELSILKPSYRCEIWLSRRQPNIKTIRKFVTKNAQLQDFTWPLCNTPYLLNKWPNTHYIYWNSVKDRRQYFAQVAKKALLWETSLYFKSSYCRKKKIFSQHFYYFHASQKIKLVKQTSKKN